MEPTGDKTPAITRQQLEEALATGRQHPEETLWTIYRYLKAHYAAMGSVEARTLLAAYVKLHERRPSLINSCMLALALKIHEAYADFRLPQFLQAWGYEACLREEDRQPQTGKDGRRYLSLRERVERARASYLLHHPEEAQGDCDAIKPMYAVTIFKKEGQGRMRRFVKLVAPDGLSLLADSHQFPCKPWEIVGRLFDVLTRVSQEGHPRAMEIVTSDKRVEEIFASEPGYIDSVDLEHDHVHVFDLQSRHFVSDRAAVHLPGLACGRVVRFCPIIARNDPFKSAAIIEMLPHEAGLEAFGTYEATVVSVDRELQCWRYALAAVQPSQRLTQAAQSVRREGYASLLVLPESRRATLAPGQSVRLVLFLKRGIDGLKHNHVPKAY